MYISNYIIDMHIYTYIIIIIINNNNILNE